MAENTRPETQGKKKFKLTDAILSVICVVFVAEAAAPVAAIGNSQYFWWIFLMLTFLLPYGLIASELGTTYDGEGGLYDWVRKAFGAKWGTRVSWYYWINFPLWMASLAEYVQYRHRTSHWRDSFANYRAGVYLGDCSYQLLPCV